MQCATKERWLELCQLAIVERDPDKFAAISRELWQLLAAKQQRLGIDFQPVTTCWICSKSVSLEAWQNGVATCLDVRAQIVT